MDPVEIVLSVVVGLIVIGILAGGAASNDPNTSCLSLVTGGCLFAGGALFGIGWGIGKVVGWW